MVLIVDCDVCQVVLIVCLLYREYLSGFRKRKDQRRKIAKQKLEKRIQEERKALREAVRYKY